MKVHTGQIHYGAGLEDVANGGRRHKATNSQAKALGQGVTAPEESCACCFILSRSNPKGSLSFLVKKTGF